MVAVKAGAESPFMLLFSSTVAFVVMNGDHIDNFWMTLRLRSMCVAFRTSVLCGALFPF